MSFIRRLFSSDRRAALRAEATGDFELAAERYALAGDAEAVVRMHLARAERANTRALEIDALRDAVHWAREDESLLKQARPALALALLAQAEAEGIATERDKKRVREAADLLQAADRWAQAGDAFASIGDTEAAIEAYRAGGVVGKLELALASVQEERERGRVERNDFADYEMYMRGGDRDRAMRSLRACIEAADSSSEYRRELDELETRIITEGRVQLRDRRGKLMNLTATPEILLGRDPVCDLSLRSGGISRQHAIIAQTGRGADTVFSLSDAGSRNGTRMAGMPIETSLPLSDAGSFQLGDDLEVRYSESQGLLHLEVPGGLDRGAELWASSEERDMSLAPLGITSVLQFRQGRPFLRHEDGAIELGDERIAFGEVQLIHGDQLRIDGLEIEVL